jgi:hypothetical protein
MLQGRPGGGIAVLINRWACLLNQGVQFGKPALRVGACSPPDLLQSRLQPAYMVTGGGTPVSEPRRAGDRIVEPA